MAQITSRKLASSKDALFGIDSEDIAIEITQDNWEEKATVRITPNEQWVYLWVDEVDVKDKWRMYEVCAKEQSKSRMVMKRFFDLRDALEYANAEKGKFKNARRPNGPKEIPNLPNQGQLFFPNLDDKKDK